MARYDWKRSLSENDEDISKYLKKRYEDYCRDIGEYSEDGKDWYKNQDRKKHWNKQDRLIEFGFKLRDKMKYYPKEMRKDLLEKIITTHKQLDKYFLDNYDKLLKKHKEKNLLKHKEKFGQYIIMENIDEYIAKLKRLSKERKKKEAEEEVKRKKEAKEEAKRKVLIERRHGHSNIKPLSFYKEVFDDEITDEEQEFDTYFQENGKPKGVWKQITLPNTYKTKEYWEGDFAFSDKETDIYVLVDNPDENQKLLNRCKEIADIIVNLNDSEDICLYLSQIELYQQYLTEGYLITRQIALNICSITYLLIEELSKDPNNPNYTFRDHPSRKYDFNIYKDDFNIIEIKEDVTEFERLKEKKIFTPLECLKVYLEKHDNRITAKEYSVFINKSYKVALRILKEFVKEKKLKSKKEFRGLNIFHV